MVSIDDNTVTSTRGDTLETKIIKAVFDGDRYAVTAKRTRTDYGQVLEFVDVVLPDTFECIFSNSAASSGVGKKQIGSAQRVLIPDEYLATGQAIYAWVLVHDGDDDGRHMYNVKIPVVGMPDTSPEEPTPMEQSVISQAITALNSAVDTTTQKAQEATESADRAEHAAEGVEGYAERAEAAQSASESARDIALEAKVSAQASAATATEKASEAISSATTASQSALTAENASESAQEYATASAESASQASQSADTASGKASDASESAQAASQKATEASQKALESAQSASTAVQAKTDAESAKTASETAQGLAESARDGAVSAKTVAETARDEAQDIVDGISGKVEQIDSNTTRIESLEDDRYKPYPTDTASGSIASFPDGADDIPLKSCIVHVEPVQAGSGDPSPENVRPISGWTGCEVQRTGKNLIPDDIEYVGKYGVDANGKVKNGIFYTIYFPIPKGTLLYHADEIKGVAQYTLIDEPVSVGVQTYGGAPSLTNYNNRFIDNTEGHKYLMLMGTTTDDGMIPIERLKSYGITFLYQDYAPGVYTEPKPSQTYPITFPTEAGIVYGAYVDVIGGELVVDRAQIASYNGETLPSTWISDRDVYASGTTPTIGAQVVYKLAEPIHYPLTANQINSLYGQNNIWADTGDVSVEYRADVKLYINKKIAEAISALS